MNTALYLIVSYDLYWLRGVIVLLLWLEEWLGISQTTAERAMIVVYIAITNFDHTRWGDFDQARWGVSLISGIMMWLMHISAHREPPSVFVCVIRGSLQIVLLLAVVLSTLLAPHRWTDVAVISAHLVFMVFWYSTAFRSNGQRGRRRKLALDKLKALFGDLGWLPAPQEG